VKSTTVALGLAVAILMAHRAVGNAQSVRGTVIDSATGAPLTGAVIFVFGADGRQLTRTLTNTAGTFEASTAAAGARVRVIHIGFTPVEAAIVSPQRIDIAMRRVAFELSGLQVTSRLVCPSDHGGTASVRLLQQAQAGFLTTVVARESNLPELTTWIYERRQSARDSVTIGQTVRVRRGTSSRPFLASDNAARLQRDGYVRRHGQELEFLAPDADVLLDEAFVGAHCFREAAAGSTGSHVAALSFVPVPHSDTPTDVAGTIWLTTNPRVMLDSVEFHYTGLDEAQRSAAGHIRFETPTNGATFVQRWSLELPIAHVQNTRSAALSGGGVSRTQSTEVVVDETYVTGGIVVNAVWRDGTRWTSASSGVHGQVVDRGDRQPVVRALVTLAGTADTLVTSDSGYFSADRVIPGTYVLRASDTSLAALHRDRSDSRVVRIREGQQDREVIEVPSIRESIAQVCGQSHSVSDPGMLMGRVTLPDSAIRSARVQVSWKLVDPSLYGSRYAELNRDVDVDSRSRFVVCALPLERPLAVRLSLKTGSADTTVAITRGYVRSLEWTVNDPRRSE
jgi:hypothetical protein